MNIRRRKCAILISLLIFACLAVCIFFSYESENEIEAKKAFEYNYESYKIIKEFLEEKLSQSNYQRMRILDGGIAGWLYAFYTLGESGYYYTSEAETYSITNQNVVDSIERIDQNSINGNGFDWCIAEKHGDGFIYEWEAVDCFNICYSDSRQNLHEYCKDYTKLFRLKKMDDNWYFWDLSFATLWQN